MWSMTHLCSESRLSYAFTQKRPLELFRLAICSNAGAYFDEMDEILFSIAHWSQTNAKEQADGQSLGRIGLRS